MGCSDTWAFPGSNIALRIDLALDTFDLQSSILALYFFDLHFTNLALDTLEVLDKT